MVDIVKEAEAKAKEAAGKAKEEVASKAKKASEAITEKI